MKQNLFICAVLLSLTCAASAQNTPAAKSAPATIDTMPKAGEWRASKLIGLNVYNDQNERLGDINEVMIEASGKVIGYVIGVGGFLGIGEHAIIVEPSKLKFVNEAMRTTTSPSSAPPPGSTTASRPPGTNTAVATTTSTNRAYPDHAVLSATKDQLKTLPKFSL